MLFLAPFAPAHGATTALTAQAEQNFERGAPVPAWVLPSGPLPAAPDAPFSIRLADLQYHIDATTTVYQHRAITARETGGVGALGSYEVEFQPEYQHLLLHRLAIIRDGKVLDRLHEADIRFLQREAGLEQGMYSGSVTAAIVTPDVRAGDTLDLEYSVVGENPVFDHRFADAAQWDYATPVAWRRVVVDTPEARPVRWRLIGDGPGPRPQLSERHADGRVRMHFEMRNMPAVVADQDVPRDVAAYRWLQFSEYASWDEVRDWAQALFVASDPAGALAGPLKAARAAPTRAEAVVRVLEFVQGQIRYLSLSLGENSHRPYPPDQVLARRYGDCKDKSLLTVTMLRQLGITADPVLVSTQLFKRLDQYLPSPVLFDHVIVRVQLDGHTWYLDPTRQGQHGELARFGQALAGAQVFPIGSGEARLATIPMPAPGTQVQKRIERVQVTAMDQPPEVTVISELTGTAAENIRARLPGVTPAELRKASEALLAERYPGAQLLGEPVVKDDPLHNVLVLERHFRVPNYFKKTDQGWDIEVTADSLRGVFSPPGSSRRQHPLALPYPAELSYSLDVQLPPAVRQSPARKEASVDDPGFRARRELEVLPNGFHAALTLSVLDDRVAADRVADYYAKLQQFDALRGAGFRVFRHEVSGAPAATVAAAAPVPAAAAHPLRSLSEEERLRQTLAATTRAVQTAEQGGDGLADALCERARIEAWLGQAEAALRDLHRATEADAQSDTLLACLGQVYFTAGKLHDAVTVLTRAIAHGAVDGAVYTTRGLANQYLGQRTAAAADFRQVVTTADDPNQRVRAAALLAGAGEPAQALATKADGSTDWLVSARNLMQGQGDPEHMLGLAARGAADGEHARLTEAYYYVGRYWLAQHNPIRARVYFQRALDKQALTSVYRTAARLELQGSKP